VARGSNLWTRKILNWFTNVKNGFFLTDNYDMNRKWSWSMHITEVQDGTWWSDRQPLHQKLAYYSCVCVCVCVCSTNNDCSTKAAQDTYSMCTSGVRGVNAVSHSARSTAVKQCVSQLKPAKHCFIIIVTEWLCNNNDWPTLDQIDQFFILS